MPPGMVRPPPPDPPSTSVPTFEGENISLVSYLFQEKNSKNSSKTTVYHDGRPTPPTDDNVSTPTLAQQRASWVTDSQREGKWSLKPTKAMGGAAHGHDEELHPPKDSTKMIWVPHAPDDRRRRRGHIR